jgi:hypothetical protein
MRIACHCRYWRINSCIAFIVNCSVKNAEGINENQKTLDILFPPKTNKDRRITAGGLFCSTLIFI